MVVPAEDTFHYLVRALCMGWTRIGSGPHNALMPGLRAAAALTFCIFVGDLHAYPVRYDFSGWVDGVEISPEKVETPFEATVTGSLIFEGGPAIVRLPARDEYEWPHFRVRLSETVAIGSHIWSSTGISGQFCDVYLTTQHQEVQFECRLDLGGDWRLQSAVWLHDPDLLPDDSRIPEGPFVGDDDSGGKLIWLNIFNDFSEEGIFARGGARLERISSVEEPASGWLLFAGLTGMLIHRRTKGRCLTSWRP